MQVDILTPDTALFSGEASVVSLPGVNGSFQILNNHAPIVSILGKGLVKITSPRIILEKEATAKFLKINDQNFTLAITSGTIEMKDNKVIVLVD